MVAHHLSRTQMQAVRSVMRLLAEDDLAHGIALSARAACDGCRRIRPAAGFVRYDEITICNRCATLYELARLRRRVWSVADFLDVVSARGSVERRHSRRSGQTESGVYTCSKSAGSPTSTSIASH